MKKTGFINIPKSLETISINSFITKIEALLSKNEPITLVLEDCNFISPTGAVYFQSIFDTSHRISIKKNRRGLLTLLGKKDYTASAAYEEITKKIVLPVTICESVSDTINVLKIIRKNILRYVDCDKETICAIDYSLNELIDNAGVHGYKSYNDSTYKGKIYIAGAVYGKYIEIAVLDRGQGIYKSLSSRKAKYKIYNMKEALLMAINEGVTGNPLGSVGFGLYITSEIMKSNEGELNIWSSGGQLSVTKERNHYKPSDYKHGTIVTLIFKTNKKIPYEKLLGKDVEQYLDQIDEDTISVVE